MISYLKGKIKNKGQGFVIVEVNSVGYKLFIHSSLYAELSIGQEVELYTHQYVREDALDLYGFRTMEELEMFEMFLSISGIGPKSALGILTTGSIADIKNSISSGDSSLLTKVSGIGKKTAERIVLELREKIGFLVTASGPAKKSSGTIASGDEIDALMSLGYSMSQAREALRRVDPKLKSSGERIREALKNIK